MENSIYIGNCPICREYGRLEVIIHVKTSDCSVMCEECLAEWNTPEDALKNVNGFRKSYQKAEARTATLEEVESAGWGKYIIK